jgi:tetratricopeptide (TPR) repeat protein
MGELAIKFFFLFVLFRMFLDNPIASLVLVIIIYAIVDRNFIGFLPDFFKPVRRWQKMSALKREIELSPSLGRAYYELGALQVESGNMKDGRSNLEKAHTLMPEHPDIEYYLGIARIKTGALDMGKEVLESALKLNPKIKYAFPYVYLIEYTLKKGAALEQIDTYIEKIREYGNPEIFYELGTIFQREGHKEKAREMFNEAQASLKDCPSFMRKQYRYFTIKAKIKNIWM